VEDEEEKNLGTCVNSRDFSNSVQLGLDAGSIWRQTLMKDKASVDLKQALATHEKSFT
jgi:hypothetical protein